MTTEELKSLGRRVYDAINAQDLAALDELFDRDVVRHAAGGSRCGSQSIVARGRAAKRRR